jgi:uncharacterized sporulation protein YeaH/YhbH (DUF444 family)
MSHYMMDVSGSMTDEQKKSCERSVFGSIPAFRASTKD